MEITLWWAICEGEDRQRYVCFWIETEKSAYIFNILPIKGRKRLHPSPVWLDRFRFFYIIKVVDMDIWDYSGFRGALEKGNFVVDQEKVTRMLSLEGEIEKRLKEELRA